MPEANRSARGAGAEPSTVWTRPHGGARGPRPEHSRSDIATAAVDLADSGGLSAVTMRAVARGLGSAAASLYRYVTSRNDLLDLMVDAALAELPLDRKPEGGPLDELVLLARDQLALYRRHPWLLEAAARGGALGPNAMNYFEYCLRIMAPLTCGTPAKLEAVAMITGVVSLFARLSPGQARQATPAHLFQGADPQAHPHLVAALGDPTPPAPRVELFDRTVRSILRDLLLSTGSR